MTSGKARGTSAEVWGELLGNLWIALRFAVREVLGNVAQELPFEVRRKSGKSRDFPEARWSLIPSQREAKIVSNEKLNFE